MNEPSPAGNELPRRGFWRRTWHWLWQRPRKRWLLGIPAGAVLAFAVGILFSYGVVGVGLPYVNRVDFCTSCHEMRIPFAQLQKSPHWSNKYGVRAVCANCHVPPTLAGDLLRHFHSSGELFNHFAGTISTPAKFEAHKLQLAEKVWKEMQADNSASCRSCHSFAAMALDQQDHSAAIHHSPQYLAKTGKTCIDCHKGVAHTLPANVP